MELGLAIYGALVGTAAFGWGVYQWRRSRRPDVTIFIAEEDSIDSGESLQAMVVNRGTQPYSNPKLEVPVAEVGRMEAGAR